MKPPICGTKFHANAHSASTGASGIPSNSARGQHHHAVERGHESRTRGVARDCILAGARQSYVLSSMTHGNLARDHVHETRTVDERR